MAKMSTGGKIAIGFVVVALLTGIVLFIINPGKAKATGKKEVKPAGAPGMPDLYVEQDTVQTDDYTINFGVGQYFYTRGDEAKTFKLDNNWSLKVETTQDGDNLIEITVLQNGNSVFRKNYL